MRVKDPVTEEEFELRKEQQMVEECETLVNRMQNAIEGHKYIKPATLATFREFSMTSRLIPH